MAGPRCTENPIYVLPEMKLRSLISEFLHLCICERFIYSQDRSAHLGAENMQTNLGIYKSLTDTECGDLETENYIFFLNKEATQFHF